MSAAKVVTVRLPEGLLERVDALIETGFDNRSDALRHLVETGIDSDAIHLRIQDLEEKLSRLMYISEQQYKLSYINALIAKDGRADINERMPEFKEAANKSLASSMVQKFGE